MWRKRVSIVFILLIAGSALALWSGEEKPVIQKTQPVANYVAAEGRVSVKPDRRALLAAEIAGRVESISVDALSPVKKGQILAVLYNADLEKQIRQYEGSYRQAESRYRELINGSRKQDVEEAAANLRRAESELELALRNEERDRKLWEEQVVSSSKLDATVAERKKAESELQAAKERHNRVLEGERPEVIQAGGADMHAQKYALESLKASYEKTIVRSPLNGVVLFRHRNVSEFADIGDPILEVADLSEIIIEGDVNEIDAGRVRNGQKVIVTSDAFPGRTFSGEVYEVNAALKRRESEPVNPAVIIDQKILPVKVRFLEPVPLKLGMKVDLKILSGEL